MKFSKMHTVYNLGDEISRKCNLSHEDSVKVIDYIESNYGDRMYTSGGWGYNEGEPSSWYWRLTAPIFYLMLTLSAIIIQPIKWVITGRYFFEYKPNRWLEKWADKALPK